MFETLMHTLRAFLGHGVLRTALATSLAVVVLALAASTGEAFRQGLAGMTGSI